MRLLFVEKKFLSR